MNELSSSKQKLEEKFTQKPQTHNQKYTDISLQVSAALSQLPNSNGGLYIDKYYKSMTCSTIAIGLTLFVSLVFITKHESRWQKQMQNLPVFVTAISGYK